ncbi:hypothetical protein MTO96_027546 [Rhipicephalus appendiculatus]
MMLAPVIRRHFKQSCDHTRQCASGLCCVSRRPQPVCLHYAKVRKPCSLFPVFGVYLQHCPCAPDHGLCINGRCSRLRNQFPQHL